ncbi:MAG: type II toxin-antitoxin system Phd/YefM family antitoxin [Chloroflexota bacterium]|nr:type II toxin-antitoxin system Phd/YefM family antitoxin [Chloroflexota bacterium]
MSGTVTSTETIGFTEARQHLSQLVNRVARRETRVLLEKSGVPVAALVSPEDLRRLGELDAGRAERFAAMREFSRAFADVSDEDLERELADAQAITRAELRTEREAVRRQLPGAGEPG